MRRHLTVLLLLIALLPTAGLAGFAAWTLGLATGVASERSAAAVEAEARQRLAALVAETARRDDLFFERARADAMAVARFAAFLYARPDLFPKPLEGGTPLVRTPAGHLVNEPSTPVGVFVPRGAPMTPAVWREVGLLSHIDPLLIALHGRTPAVQRLWFISASRTVRIYPNLGLGHEGSPVGPDYDLTADVFFERAAPPANPSAQPVWSPPYDDPAGQGMMVTAAVPVVTADGLFHGVAGADVRIDDVIGAVLAAAAQGPGDQALLLDGDGRIVAAPPGLLQALGLRVPPPQPGRVVDLRVADAPDPKVREQMEEVLRADAQALLSARLGGEDYLVAVAPLPSTGWRLALLRPRTAVVASARAAAETMTGLRRRFLAWIGLGLAVLAGAVAALAWRMGRLVSEPIARLAEGARRLGTGDLTHRIREDEPAEFGLLAREFNAMADRLARLTEHLEAEVARRSAALVAEERQVAILAERNRLAREIHDTLAQGLAGILLHLQAAEQVADSDATALRRHLDRAAEAARQSLGEARRSVWNLRPGLLEGRSLADALAELAHLAHPGRPRVTFRQVGEPRPLPPDVETTLLRAGQEGLANALRHARASRIELRLTYGPEAVELTVEDDGVGPQAGSEAQADPGPQGRGGLGLRGMAERAAAVGGEVKLGERPGGGAVLRVRIPLDGVRRNSRLGPTEGGKEALP